MTSIFQILNELRLFFCSVPGLRFKKINSAAPFQKNRGVSKLNEILKKYNGNLDDDNTGFSVMYRKVMLWLVAQMLIATGSMILLGPVVPPAIVNALLLATVVIMLVTAFVRKGLSRTLAPVFAAVVPAIIGMSLWLVVSTYVAQGAGDLVVTAAFSSGTVFVVMAVIGYTSTFSLEKWSGRMFAILIGVVVAGAVNAFILHSSLMSLLISIVSVVLFSLYVFIDIQRIRDNRRLDDNPTAAMFALDLFLDLVNLFLSILNILDKLR